MILGIGAGLVALFLFVIFFLSCYKVVGTNAVGSKSRIEIAARDREAVEAEQENRQKAEVAKANSEKVFTTSQIERDQVIGIRAQEKDQHIAQAAQETNKQQVAAFRVTTVGRAEVEKEAAITAAQGEGEAIRVKGEKAADVVKLTGTADAAAIEAKGLAEAKAKDAMAEALKKFNEAGISLEQIRASVEIQKAFAKAYEQIAGNAEIKIINSGEGNILGLPISAAAGANIGQMFKGIGIDIEKLGEAVQK